MPAFPMPAATVLQQLREGQVIPAHPLALTKNRKLDERRQRALTRYYHAAGAGGVAIGVHTTQFEIRMPKHGLFKPVLELAAQTITECDTAANRQTVRIAGVCGRTPQAAAEAAFARATGYHAGLLSLAAFRDDSEKIVLEHCRSVAREISVFGFYLQPAVGGRRLSVDFWRRFAEIPNVVGIKIAAFNRYQTLDVLRAIAEVGRTRDIALYTGNDDNILLDLLTPYQFEASHPPVRIVGGLLGHWACWTRIAVSLLQSCRAAQTTLSIPQDMLTLAAQVTDCNSALFDPAHGFAGCIAGVHEVLRRQGLLSNRVCLDPKQVLSPGQKNEIDRVHRAYPELNDDSFVREHLDDWMRP